MVKIGLFVLLSMLGPALPADSFGQVRQRQEIKRLPNFVVEEVREVIRYLRPELNQEQLIAQVEAFCEGVVYISKLNNFLNTKKILDKSKRELIRQKAAFTINESWPIYINGEDRVVGEAGSSESGGPKRGRLRGIIYHELWHANGHKDELGAIAEEIKFLERLVPSGAIDIDWVNYRKTTLASVRKQQRSGSGIHANQNR